MAFWGIEVKPGKPFVYHSDDEKGRLHVSQATLGTGSSTMKSIVQCKVGDKKPIYLCSLLPEKFETCALNLEFEEGEEATFSIIGSHSVHLSGFFYGDNEEEDDLGHDYEFDSYEDSEDDTSSDSEDEHEYNNVDDFDMYPHSPIPNSGVKIEEIVDDIDEKPTSDENGSSKQTKKKKSKSNMPSESENRQIVSKAAADVPIFESEDEDGFPMSAHQKKSDAFKDQKKVGATSIEMNDEKIQKTTGKGADVCGNKLKRKNGVVDQEEKLARENVELLDSTAQPEVKKKRKKNQKVGLKSESNLETRTPNPNVMEESPAAEIGNDLKPSSQKKKEKKKKKKQKKEQESVQTLSGEEKPADELKQHNEAKPLQVRTFPNGLVVEELEMGKPAGRRAANGKKVSVRYIGKLKKNGKIFDSNIGKAPFKFRLGIGQVIKGWDVGVNGMRIGDKRRLTIPPAMGYGSKGCSPVIPPNSWLVFDVELVDVN